MNSFEKIDILLKISTLSRESRYEFLNVLKKIKEEDLAIIEDLLRVDLKYANFLLTNYKEKIKIMKNNDKKSWEKMLEAEEKIIKRIVNV